MAWVQHHLMTSSSQEIHIIQDTLNAHKWSERRVRHWTPRTARLFCQISENYLVRKGGKFESHNPSPAPWAHKLPLPPWRCQETARDPLSNQIKTSPVPLRTFWILESLCFSLTSFTQIHLHCHSQIVWPEIELLIIKDSTICLITIWQALSLLLRHSPEIPSR